MRKLVCALSLAAATTLAVSSAQAAPEYTYQDASGATAATVGVVGGTVFGLGLSEGWFGPTLAGATFPTTVAGAAAVGGVAGIGGIALVDAALQPCRGFHAMFGLNREYCASLNSQQIRRVQHQRRVGSNARHRERYATR